MDKADKGMVVVGVDGSECSRDALAFALRDAARRGARVKVLSVVRPVDEWATAYGLPSLPPRQDPGAIRTQLHDIIAGVREVLGDAVAGVEVEPVVTIGSTAGELIKAAADADLLVVGSQGRGGVASALLGSVTTRVVFGAPCPVTVIRPRTGS
ncbi:MAG: universal stress protein [Mycobacteriaceae bacterium]